MRRCAAASLAQLVARPGPVQDAPTVLAAGTSLARSGIAGSPVCVVELVRGLVALPSSWGLAAQADMMRSTPSPVAEQAVPSSSVSRSSQTLDSPPDQAASLHAQARMHSHYRASTSSPSSSSATLFTAGPASGAWASASDAMGSLGMQLVQQRHYGHAPPKRSFPLPPGIAELVQQKLTEASKAEQEPQISVPPLEPRPLQPESRRTGVIAVKAGMTQEWDEYGVRVPLTVLWIDDCQVVGVRTQEKHGYNALQMGAGYKRQKCMRPSQAGYFLTQGVPFKRMLTEFHVSPDALLPVGTHVGAAHYVAGQRVDVTGWTKYKGFAGVMKRWGFKGLPASHGVSLSHRKPGSTGGRQDPGKIWKGKKLPGDLGDERRTVANCLVYKVDPARNLVYIRGQIPGPAGKSIFMRDSLLAPHDLRVSWGLPFPTHVGSDPATLGAEVYRNPLDPYTPYRLETDYFPIEWKKGE